MDDSIDSILGRELGETATVVGRFDEGHAHETYEVRFEGAEYVLQLADADEAQQARLERGLDCYRLLQNTGIPVPSLVTESVQEHRGRTYVLVEKLPGSSGERDISPERVRSAGRYLAGIHEVTTFESAGRLRFDDGSPRVEAFEEGSLRQWRRCKARNSAERLRAGGLDAAGRKVSRLLDEKGVPSRDAFEAVLCHGDYSPDNVLFRNHDVTGVVDFDLAHAGDRHPDIAGAANGFWMHDPGADWDVRETFYEGYRDVHEPDPFFEANEPLYRVEALAGAVGGMLALDELSDYEKEFYSERLLEAIDRVSQR